MKPANPIRISFLEEKLKEKSEGIFFPLYKHLKDWAEATWKDHKDVVEQVEHGFSHSQKLHEFADSILEQKILEDFLTENEIEKEIFLILSSIYLHDIGMQTDWKESLDIQGTRGNLTREERKSIRDNHAETTGRILRSWHKQPENLPGCLREILSPRQKAIICNDLNKALAYICEFHNKKDIALNIDSEIASHIGKTRLKIDFITALLQVCDALHMDKSRLNEEAFIDSLDKFMKGKAQEAQYTDEDWRRFFQCYYIEDVVIKPLNPIDPLNPIKNEARMFIVRVLCRFNTDEEETMIDTFKSIYENRLRTSQYDCVSILNRHGIHFSNKYFIEILDADSSKLKLPDSMINILARGLADNVIGTADAAKEKRSETSAETQIEVKKPEDTIKENIARLLDDKELSRFRDELTGTLHKNITISNSDLTEILAKDTLPHALSILIQALENCLKKIKDRGGASNLLKRNWRGAASILGWIVLFAIDPVWLGKEKAKDCPGKHKEGSIRLKFPVKSELGVEIIYAGLKDAYAKFVGKSKAHLQGREQICGISPLETGWELKDTILNIKQQIYKAVFHDNPPTRFKPDDNTFLNTTLFIRAQKGEHCYLPVDTAQFNSPFNVDKIYTILKQDLPDLMIVFYSTDSSETVMRIDEVELNAYITEFFRIGEEYGLKENETQQL